MVGGQLPSLPVGRAGASAIFDQYAEFIIDGWTLRGKQGQTGRVEGANAWFKRKSYSLIKHYVEHDLLSVLKRNPRKDGRSHKLIEEASRNPFKLGLLAMFSDDTLTRGNRHVFGNQMLWAWAHDVPTDFLNAFLAVTGGPGQIATKLKVRAPETGFEHRFQPGRLPIDLA